MNSELDEDLKLKISGIISKRLDLYSSNIPSKETVYKKFAGLNKFEIIEKLKQEVHKYLAQTQPEALEYYDLVQGSKYSQVQRVFITSSFINYLKIFESLLFISILDDFFDENTYNDFLFCTCLGSGFSNKSELNELSASEMISSLSNGIASKITFELKYPIFRDLVGDLNSGLYFDRTLIALKYLIDNPGEREECLVDTFDAVEEIGAIFIKTVALTSVIDEEVAPQESFFYNLSIEYFNINEIIVNYLNELLENNNPKVLSNILKRELLDSSPKYHEMILKIISSVSKVDKIVKPEEDILLTVFCNYFSLPAQNYSSIQKVDIFIKQAQNKLEAKSKIDQDLIIQIVKELKECSAKQIVKSLKSNGVIISKYQFNTLFKESNKLQSILEKNNQGLFKLKERK